MTIDMRREHTRIGTEFGRFENINGEQILWFVFDVNASRHHEVYDETGESWLSGVAITVMWIDQIEDAEQFSDRGRRPTQRFRAAVSGRTLEENGISPTEAHGGRTWDPIPPPPSPPQIGRPEAQWRRDRVNDLIYYDGRIYGLSNFQIRGRARYADAVISITGIEKQPEDEFDFDQLIDLFPPNWSPT